LTREVVQPFKAKSPVFYDALLTQRNKKWTSQLTKFMREQGYTVARYYAFQGEDVINPINPTIERPVGE